MRVAERTPRGEPLWCIKKHAHEIHPSTSAASNRLKQAAPLQPAAPGVNNQTLCWFSDERSGDNSVTSGKIYIGTSGWVYKDWAKKFNPKEIAKKRRLEFYAYPVSNGRNQCQFLPVTDGENGR
jgi:hypothetical protein